MTLGTLTPRAVKSSPSASFPIALNELLTINYDERGKKIYSLAVGANIQFPITRIKK